MDVIACESESVEGKALLKEVMVDGRRSGASPPLAEIRRHCAEQLAQLPPRLKSLEPVRDAPVKVSQQQHALAAQVGRSPH
jgi:nicotinate phosphoribosyltransferase